MGIEQRSKAGQRQMLGDFTRAETRYVTILETVKAQPLAVVRRAQTPTGTLVCQHLFTTGQMTPVLDRIYRPDNPPVTRPQRRSKE